MASRSSTTDPIPIIDITAPKAWELPNLRELYRYRELLLTLTWRDIRVLYKQTLIGAPWVLLQPLILMGIYSLIFGVLLQVPSNGLPFTLFVFIGLMVWNFFSLGIGRASSSILANAGLTRKVYFPRLILPVASVLSGLSDFIPTFLLTIALALIYGYLPTLNYLLLIFPLALLFITTLGLAIWVAALNTAYRDVGLAIPLVLQVLFYVSPIIYSSSILGENWRTVMGIFPIPVVVESTRWLLTGVGEPLPVSSVVLAVVCAGAIFISGLFIFKRVERQFVDLV